MITKFHNYFLLTSSPLPVLISLNSFNLLFSLLIFLKYSYFNSFLLILTIIFFNSMSWWIAYSNEFNTKGDNSNNLEMGIKVAMILFISSEIFFFFSFFWSYFHYSSSPMMEIGMIWPPVDTEAFDASKVPLINTLILLSSGVTVTMSHMYLNQGNGIKFSLLLFSTVALGVIFSIMQGMEYSSSFFSINDSTFGTSFFMLTGFHGIHVLIGTVFLLTTLIRSVSISFSKINYLSFELASWYWHFVDVVWIFLYFFLYYANN